jgi:hypothetical protein
VELGQGRDATWGLAEAFEKLEATTSGLRMIDILANLPSRLSPDEAQMAAYLLRGRVAPRLR